MSGMENFVPGIGILGGAMAFGASLLNPESSIADLQKELQEIKTGMVYATQSKAIVRALQRQQKELEQQIENPVGEIKSNYADVKAEMRHILKSIERKMLSFRKIF